jgi:2-iminobutanoate/2-iminopropanoate deaminase
VIKSESISLPEAEKAIEAGMATARRYGRVMAFAVADSKGELIACARMDGAHPRILRHAIRKAYTAAQMERNTLSFKKDLEDRQGNLDEWGDASLTTLQGGHVVKSGTGAVAVTVGAVAAGGAPPELDEEVARCMVRAMGFSPTVDERLIAPWKVREASSRQGATLPLAERWIAAGQEPTSARRIGRYVFTSGVPGIDVATGELPQDPAKQFQLAFRNLQMLMESSGVGSAQSIGLVNVYIPDASYRPYINKSWLDLFPGPARPARKTNQAPLPPGLAVQLQAVAVVGEEGRGIEIPGLAHRDPLPMGCRVGPLVFSSVMGGQDPATGEFVAGAGPQIERCFENMRLFMEQAGGSAAGINHVWVFMKDFALQPQMVDVWNRMFPTEGDRPARKTVPYDLPPEVHIQVQLIGGLEGKRTNFELPGVWHHDPIPLGSRVGDLLCSSGVHGIDPKTKKVVAGLAAQTEVGLKNARDLVVAAGGKDDDIAALTILVKDLEAAPAVLKRLNETFPDARSRPALKFVNYRLPGELEVQFHVTAVLGG